MYPEILRRIALCCCIATFLCTMSCRQDNPVPQPITYRLKWLYNMSVVGDLYAVNNGHFDNQGLNVIVKPGGPERDAIKELEIGRAHFGVASADQVIRAVAKGAPIVVIAQLFQTNPLQWIYRNHETVIASPRDLTGKTIGITYGGNDEIIMHTLLTKNNIAGKDVRFFSVRYDYTPFYQGIVDLWPVYRNAEGIIIGEKLRQQGESIAFLDPSRFGVRFVANSVITTRNMLESHPELVNTFITALLQGWQEAMDPNNSRQAIKVIQENQRDTVLPILNRQLTATRTLTAPPKGKPFGWIDVDAWQETEKIMLLENQIEKPIGVEKILFQISSLPKAG